MAESKNIFVDLDRTLFDTDVFVASLWLFLSQKLGVDAAQEKTRAKQFYRYDGELYDYQFFDHLASLQLGDLNSIAFDITVNLRKQLLLFQDVEQGLEILEGLGDVHILTFGNERYQSLKLSCVPELLKYPAIFVQQHKKHYFEKNFASPAILIDDKDLGGSLPDTVDFYLINRLQVRPVEEHEGYKSIRKLYNIKEALTV